MHPSVRRDLALITLGGLVLHLAFLADQGHVVDLQIFGQWALAAADNPWNMAYEATNANYPPAALLVFELIGRTYRALGLNDSMALRIALKLPNALFDAFGGLVTYAIAARFVEPRRALIGAALFALNPAIIYDSALWGQNDSLTTVTTLAALWSLLNGWRIGAWLLLAAAVLNKPPVVVLAPLFILEACARSDGAQRRQALRATGIGVALAVVLGYLLALPFYRDRSFFAVYARMLDWYQIGSSLYPFTSANGFNLWALAGDFFQPDRQTVFGVACKNWADLIFIAVDASILWNYWRARSGRALLGAAFLIMLAFFLVLTEMHERYLMYAVAVAPAVAVLDRRYLWAALVITLTAWLNLEYSLTYMWIESAKPPGIDVDEFAPVLVHLCVFANVGAWILGLQTLRDERHRDASDEAVSSEHARGRVF